MAAHAGVIPPLQQIIRANSPLKQFALSMLCDFAHCGAAVLEILWEQDGCDFYMNLLRDSINAYWQINVLEALVAW